MYKPLILKWRKTIIEDLKKNWELVNWCEFDTYASKSYCAIHNETVDKNLGDITKVNENEIDDFTWGCGGSPCQDFSVAGKQEGAKWTCEDCHNEYNPLEAHYSKRDECPKCHSKNIVKTRSSLIVELLRIIREKKPKVFLYENVKNLIGKQFKATFDLFIAELGEYGYNCHYKVLNAKNYGIPQNRERVYIVIVKKELDNGKFEFPEPFDNGVRLKHVLDTEVDEKFYISQDKVNKIINSKFMQEKLRIQTGDICSCLLARDYKDPKCVPIDKSYNNPKAIEYANCITAREDRGISNRKAEGAAVLENKVTQVGNIVDTGNWDNPQRGRIYSPDGCCPALNCCGGGGLEPKIIQPQSAAIRGRYTEDGDIEQQLEFGSNDYINTITTVQKDNVLVEDKKIDNFRIRKLTPKETFRLMGFSDEDFYKAKFEQKEVSDEILKKYPNHKGKRIMEDGERIERMSNSQLYKQSGNSIVVDVLFYILVELYKAMPYLFDDVKLSSFFSGIGAFEIALDRIFKCINDGTIENFTKPQVE